AEGDAPHLHARALPRPRRAAARARARLRDHDRRHRRLPWRDGGGLRADAVAVRGGRLRRRLYVRLLAAARDGGGDAARPGPASGKGRTDGTARRGRAAAREGARAALRRAHARRARRGAVAHRPDAPARPLAPQQGRQLQRPGAAGRVRAGRDRERDEPDARGRGIAARARRERAVSGARGSARGLVIFDCDGVLVDSVAIDMRELTRTIAALGGTMAEEDVHAAFHGAALGDIDRALAAHLGAPAPDRWMDAWFTARTAAFERELTSVPGAAEAVDGVRGLGWEVCVASQGEPAKMAQTLRVSGLAERFDPQRIFSATMVARGKPAPDLFLH